MTPQPLTLDSLFDALAEGWRVANATRGASIAYTAIFVVAGAAIIGSLLARGWTPFVIAAAGAFMLVGPVILAGYFGIARACEAGQGVGLAAVAAGFGGASRALWALALVCGLLFMIFVTDAAILYAYMIGDVPVWLGELLPAADGVARAVVVGIGGGGRLPALRCVGLRRALAVRAAGRLGRGGGEKCPGRVRQLFPDHGLGRVVIGDRDRQHPVPALAAPDPALAGLCQSGAVSDCVAGLRVGLARV